MSESYVPQDPRDDADVKELAEEFKELEYAELKTRLRKVKNDDMLGWVRYHFPENARGEKAWQVIVINRWLERDKFFRNVLPQWIGTVFGILSFAVSVLALIIALQRPEGQPTPTPSSRESANAIARPH